MKRVPVRVSDDKSSGQVRQSRDQQAKPQSLPNVTCFSRITYSLLITDDDDAFRDTLRCIFEPEGFRTLLANSGEEALEVLRANQVHIALLDQHMPRLTGLETLRIIRRESVELPVILMTADRTQQLIREALLAQAFCVMAKPVTRHLVLSTVHQALSRSYPFSGSIVEPGEQK